MQNTLMHQANAYSEPNDVSPKDRNNRENQQVCEEDGTEICKKESRIGSLDGNLKS